MVTTCPFCMHYYEDTEACPHTHHLLAPPGTPVTCDASDLWKDVPLLPGVVVATETSSLRRIIIALPGRCGSTAAITRSVESLL